MSISSSRFVYGKHAVEEFLKIYPEEALSLNYTESSKLSRLEVPCDLSLVQLGSKDLRKKFKLKDFESHQGLILEIKRDLRELLELPLEQLLINNSQQEKFLLCLPEIQDAHNLGALMRSAVAFGVISGIILMERGGSVRPSAVVAKISAGAVFRLKLSYFRSYKTLSSTLKANQNELLHIQNSPSAIPINKHHFNEHRGKGILLFGNEEGRLPPSLEKLSNLSLKIPQSTNIDSLNLSVAGAVIFYELSQQLYF